MHVPGMVSIILDFHSGYCCSHFCTIACSVTRFASSIYMIACSESWAANAGKAGYLASTVESVVWGGPSTVSISICFDVSQLIRNLVPVKILAVELLPGQGRIEHVDIVLQPVG